MGLAIGTPAYMAPEQATGQMTTDGRADLYAVGILGYEMLSGSPPFTGATPQAILGAHIGQTPAPLGPLRPDVAPAFAAAIMRCLEKDPADRWQSAEELLAQLEAFATPGAGVTVASPDGVPRRDLATACADRGAVMTVATACGCGPAQVAERGSAPGRTTRPFHGSSHWPSPATGNRRTFWPERSRPCSARFRV